MWVRRLGRRGYREACALQERAAAAVEAGGPDQLLWVDHPPVLTRGRGADEAQLLASPEAIRRRGVTVEATDRGGGLTYHGPGQLIGYPIVDLRRRGLGVRRYLAGLEAALVRVLRDRGIDAGVREGLTGVWTATGKLVSIGIAVRRGITRHGFALNVDPRMEHFELIRPCGLDEPVTSLERLGWRGDRRELAAALARSLEGVLTEGAPRGERPGLRLTAAAIPGPIGPETTAGAGRSLQR